MPMNTRQKLASLAIALSASAGGFTGVAHALDLVPCETYKLLAKDAAQGDWFGNAVAISGGTAIVGASNEDDAGNLAGSAYLFDVITGQQLFKLTASDAAAFDVFGLSVGISGGTAIVGAWQDDDAGLSSGSAYLFDVATGQQLFKLTACDAASGDVFGVSVAIDGDIAIIGAQSDEDAGDNSGSAYLFRAATGQQLFKLTASDAAAGDHFGSSVAISGNVAIVGAQSDVFVGGSAGSAYLFNVATGQQLFKLTASDVVAGDQFGRSVAISGNTAIVGAHRDDDDGNSSGSAYLFDVATGQQLFKLTASDAAEWDQFGIPVAISGGTAIVGALGNDDAGSASGSAYLFQHDCAPASPGDLNRDGIIDVQDRALLCAALGSSIGDPNFLDAADLNGDDMVDELDQQMFNELLPPCDGDVVSSDTFQPPADGITDAADLAFLLGAWANESSCADFVSNRTSQPPPDGKVDAADLAFLLGAWGVCE